MSTKLLSKPTFREPALFDEFFRPWNEWFDVKSNFPRFPNMPAVNIIENKENFKVALAVPGFKKDDFKIDVEGNMLTISSEKEETKEEKELSYTRKEFNYSAFSRSFTLPEEVDYQKNDAHYENGILTLLMPKKEEARKLASSRRISVN